MPRFSMWALRAALIYLAIGFTLGAILLAGKALPLPPQIWSLLPLHIEFLLLGWIVQIVFGVAYWIFPRYRVAPKRGPAPLAWAALALLNVGLLVFASSSLLAIPSGTFVGRLAEAGAVLLFVASLWGRVKATETGRRG